MIFMATKKTMSILFVLIAFTSLQLNAQSLSDLFNKDNINKVVGAVSGANKNVDLIGTWSYTGSAIEFESDNLLMKAGGAAASSTVESKLNEQLLKVGIKPGQVSFTFNADSTFTTTVNGRKMNGSYSYDSSLKQLQLKYAKLMNVNAKLSYNISTTELLFNSDKLLTLVSFLSKQTSSSSLKTIGSLADSYDGMMIGFELKKQ